MSASPHPVVGKATRRVTGPLKVSGQATYAAEFSKDFGDELAHAVLVMARVPRGTITAIDTAAAEALPGVVRVFTHLNTPNLPYDEPPVRRSVDPQVGDPLHPLQTDQIYFSGQPVAVAVAETLEVAEHAARLVRVSVASAASDMGPGTYVSVTMASVGPAVQAACKATVQKVIQIAVADQASPLRGIRASDVPLEAGDLVGPGGCEALTAVVARHDEPVEAQATATPDEQTALAFHSFGCLFARVRVDGITGEVAVEKVVAVTDVG